jgi:hypothetical protein
MARLTRYPQNVLRIVLQVEDTEENRKAMFKCLEAIKRVQFPNQKAPGILKYEQIKIEKCYYLESKGARHA